MTKPSLQRGFTAVELLITLFVAAAFLIAGYQLFSVVIKDGGETRAESKASNIAYDYMRQYSTSAGNPCVASQPLTASAISVEGLANTTITIAISCPQEDAPAVNKIEAFVTYGTDNVKTVKYATFVDTSKGAGLTNDTTTGLYGWWRFNGNANSSVGSGINGTVTAATLTVGENGASNNAYAFNGTSAYITVPSSIADPTAAITVSAWIKAVNLRTTTDQIVVSNTQSGGFMLALDYVSCPSQVGFIVYIASAFRAACASLDPSFNNAWIHLTGTYDGSSVRFYFNGTQAAAVGVSGPISYSATTIPVCIGSEAAAAACTDGDYFSGSIDDVRLYNRALTPSEVQLLYAGGAQ